MIDMLTTFGAGGISGNFSLVIEATAVFLHRFMLDCELSPCTSGQLNTGNMFQVTQKDFE